MALEEDASTVRQRLDDEVDEEFFDPASRPSGTQRHGASHERFARSLDSLENVRQALFGYFGQGIPDCRADQITISDEFAKGLVGDSEPLVGSLEQRHESRGVLEHVLEPLALATLNSKLVQHGPVIQQPHAFV